MANTSDEFNKAAGGKTQPLTEKFNGAAKGERGDGMDSIRNHKVQNTLEMKGPGGDSVRKDMAQQGFAKDQENSNRKRADKYVKMDKEKLVKGESLSKTFNRGAGREMG